MGESGERKFEIGCPYCDSGLICKLSLLGRHIKCPKCQHEFRVPKLSEVAGESDTVAPESVSRASNSTSPVDDFHINTGSPPKPHSPRAKPGQEAGSDSTWPGVAFASWMFRPQMTRMDQVIRGVAATYVAMVILCSLFAILMLFVGSTGASNTSISQQIISSAIVAGIVPFLLAGVIVLYVMPSLIAYTREHQNFVPILIINLVFGWMLIGWVGAIAWAFSSNVTDTRQTIRHINEPPVV